MKTGFAKRLFSFLICIVLIGVSVPLTVYQVFGYKAGDSEEELLYSELYYTYADYFYTNEYFKNYRSDYTRVSGYVLGEYRNMPHYTLSVVSNFLDTVTSPSEIAKYAFDNMGLTDYKFNDDIDAANVEFVREICELYTDTYDSTNEKTKIGKNLVKVSQTVDKLIQLSEKIRLDGDLEDLTKADLYDTFMTKAFYDLKEYCPNLAHIIPDLDMGIYAKVATMSELSGTVTDVLDFASAFTLAFMMQDVQIDIIDDIIAIADEDSTLYKGMTRLRSQISGGAVSYFIDTFLGDFVFEKVVDHFAGQISKSLSNFVWGSQAGLVIASVQLVNTVLFKWILGADYSSYVCANILKNYSDELSIAINNKTKSFSTSQFTVDDIRIFENSTKAYIGLNKALYNKLESISSHNESYDPDYLATNVDRNFTFQKYLNNIDYIIKNTPYDDRIRNSYDSWPVSSHTSFAPHTDNLEDGYIYTDGNFNGNIIVGSGSTLTVPEDMDISVSGTVRVIGAYGSNSGVLNVDGTINIAGDLELVPYRSGYSSGRIALDDDNDILKLGGDFVGADSYACGYITGGTIILNGNIQQNVKGLSCYDLYVFNPYGIKYESDTYIKGEFDLCGNPLDNSGYYTYIHNSAYLAEGSDYKDVTVAENGYQLKNFIQCNLYIPTGKDLIIPEGIESGIIGNVRVAGYYGSAAGYIDIDGRFIVDGNLDLIAYREGYGPGKLIMDEYDDELIVSGNLTSIDSSGFTNVTNGTIVFNGTETQELKALTAYNVVVDNPAGIKYLSDTHIYGNYYLCGNPLYNGSYVTYVYEGANLCDASDFKNVVLGSKTFTLANDVKCQLTVSSERTLIIPDGETATLYGDVKVVGRFGGEPGAIDIDGTLNVEGNLNFVAYRDGYGPGKLIMDESDDKLIITGNLTAVETSAFTDVTNGTVIFNGNDTQEVKALKAYNIKVLNSKGIKYLTDTYVYGNYDLCGNPLDNGSYVTYVYDEAKLCDGSDYKNVIIGSNSFSISNDVTCQLTVPTEHNLIIPEGETATIFGNIKVVGRFGGEPGAIDIDGTLNVEGNLDFVAYRDGYGPGKLIMDESDDKLIITGNLTAVETSAFTDVTNGTVIFNGNDTQEVKALKAYNIKVLNNKGIKYLTDTYVYGNYDLSGNPLDNGSYVTYVYDGAKLCDGSDYKNVIIGSNSFSISNDVTCQLTVPTEHNLIIPEGETASIFGDVKVIGNFGGPAGTIDIDGTFNIVGNLELANYRDPYGPGKLIMDEADDKLIITGNLTSTEERGFDSLTDGTIIFSGSETQQVKSLVAYNIVVNNPSGIKYLTDTKVYGNYDLCGNPLENGSYKTYIFETTTFADGSDYKDLIISCNDYILTNSIKANITVPTARNLYTPENERIVIDGNVTVVGYYGSPSGILDIDGTLEITGNLTLSKVYDHYSPGTVIMDEWDDALYIGGDFTGGVSGSGKFSAGKVVFNGDKLQNVQIITAPVVILENESEEGVRFNNGSTISILFDHKSNSFSLIGNGYSFVDFDGDGIKDNLDEFPRVGYSCIITVQSESPEKGSVDADSIETSGGAVHTVTATPNPGCKFISWIDSNGNTVCDTPEFIFVAKGDATYTATFEANPAYAALKEKIEESGLIDQSEYSTESFELLTAAILDARNVLTDDITEEVSQGMISVLDDAINALVLKKPVAIQLDGINEIYYSDTNSFAELNFKLVYDNGTVENLSVNDCTIENFDLYVIGQQCITVKYADFAQDIIFNVIPVSLNICSVSEIADQLFKGEEIRVIPEVYCPLNSSVLEAGKDFTVEYESAGKTGLVTVTLTGCGNYDSDIVCSYNVYCEHDYIADEHVESTCVTQGYYTEICSICSDVVINQLELSSDHRFGGWNVSEERGCLTDGTEIRICSDCDAFEIRSIPAIGEHKFGDWVTTTEPTELQNGIKTRKCDNCGAAEIEEIAKLEMTNPFTDIKPEQWYTDGILWCYHKGYMAGLSDSDFGRKQNVTRSMFVTILAKIDGADLTPYADKSSFSDVSVGKWYSSAIEWAYQNGYTSGIAEGVFGYKNDVTREQLAMFLYTYSDKKAYDISGRADLSVFIDLERVHSWARDAVSWAVNSGLISGTSATTLAPRASATRAELALIVKNYVEVIKIKSN